MSRHWTQYDYIDASSLWDFIETETAKLDLLMQADNVESSELCKLLIMGRREMLDAMSAYLHENETSLRAIVTDRHSILTREEVERLLKREYGA